MGNVGSKIERKWTPKLENILHETFMCRKVYRLFLCKFWWDFKKSNFLHGKTLYPEISDLGNTVIHMLACVYVHNYLFWWVTGKLKVFQTHVISERLNGGFWMTESFFWKYFRIRSTLYDIQWNPYVTSQEEWLFLQ